MSDQQEWLAEKGFAARSIQETWPDLLAATALSQKTERDEKARLEFLHSFTAKLADIGLDRDLGLSLLLDFVRAIRAKASFFTLLNRESRVRDNLAMLFSVSPYLGSILTSRPELIDEFIFRKQAEPSQDLGILLEGLAERRLLSELIAANHFLADHALVSLTQNLTENADSICLSLLEALKREYGASELTLLAMGKWGGRELGLRSDLDFVFLLPGESGANDQKIARRFLSRITEPHRGGSIYSVDMRLRPSGHSGPILVSTEELRIYLEGPAAAWERQAYLRSRLLSGDKSLSPAAVASARGLSDQDRVELGNIRRKLFIDEKPPQHTDELDLKLTKGGLADVEFTAQIALLDRREFSLDPSTSGMIQYLESVDKDWQSIGGEVKGHYDFLRQIEQLHQLTTSQSGSKMRVKSDEFRRLALLLNLTAADLEIAVRKAFQGNCAALEGLRVI
jgi:glutamate-ammonia-ligase adenylyltransferase